MLKGRVIICSDGILSEDLGAKILAGFIQTGIVLGRLCNAVESMAAKPVSFDGKVGPLITVALKNFHPVEEPNRFCAWETDFRFLGEGDGNPSAKEISKVLLAALPRFIEEHLKRCQGRLIEALKTVEELLAKTPSGEQNIQQEKFFHDACLDDGRPCRWDDGGTLQCNPAPGECRGCPSRPW